MSSTSWRRASPKPPSRTDRRAWASYASLRTVRAYRTCVPLVKDRGPSYSGAPNDDGSSILQTSHLSQNCRRPNRVSVTPIAGGGTRGIAALCDRGTSLVRFGFLQDGLRL